jgi:hypothetical protein
MDESALAWVPVSEALPELAHGERSGFVLVHEVFEDFTPPTVTIEVAYYDRRRDCWLARYGKLSGRVTHWQRLPAPPFEKEVVL